MARMPLDETLTDTGIARWKWRELDLEAQPRPSARCSHTSTVTGASSFVIIGGGAVAMSHDGTTVGEDDEVNQWTHFCDVWEFSSISARWARLDKDEDPTPMTRR